MYTNADLNVQKRLNFGRLNADVFFEVFNVFAQKDASVSGTDYMWYGLQKPRPNEDIYKQHGDPNDRSRYIGNPRTTHMGIRLSF